MSLYSLQKAFQVFVLHGTPGIQEHIAGNSPDERLSIYADAYCTRLIEALDSTYEKLHVLLGDEAFLDLCHAYLKAHPSHHTNVRWFGAEMDGFLQETPPYTEQSVLAEMATFEWAQTLVFDAADGPRLNIQTMEEIPVGNWPHTRFSFHPSVRRLDLAWNVPQMWQSIEIDETPGQMIQSDTLIGWVLWRQELQHHWRSVPVDEAWALDAAQCDTDFAGICEGLCEWNDAQHVALRAAHLLKAWVNDGLISSYT